MEFEKRKAIALAEMSSEESDKSPKGTLDAPIIPLLKILNLHPSYFTTSSCSGRISILSQPSPSQLLSSNTKKKKAGGGSWLFITHDLAHPDSVIDVLFHNPSSQPYAAGTLVFRFEPFILAVDCKEVASAQALVSSAISCGFRESGITSIHKRIMVAIRCSIRLEVPLGQISQLMVSPEYVRYLVGIANEKMMANRRRTDGFLQVLQFMVSPGTTAVKIDSHHRQQGCLDANQGSVSVLEEKQQDLLSKVAPPEKDTSMCTGVYSRHSKKDIYDNHEERQSTESAGLCTGDKGTNTSCKNSTKDACPSHQLSVDDLHLERTNSDLGLSQAPGLCLFAVKMTIIGEPVEKLFLWGQTASKFSITHCKQILVFGGFGGLGRHSRRNDSLMLDPQSGTLKMINADGPPSPRLGHTFSVIGEQVFVIGGRGDPTQILNDVWVLNLSENRWKLLECTGSVFHPRHRHAAGVAGSKIYVYGGLNNDMIYSCMHIFDTKSLCWSEVHIQGDWPCPRHSHSLVADESQLFMFGGYDGQKALGDLYSFDVGTCIWKKEKTIGKAPFARFSHSMFIYKYYLGIVGGCPVQQQFQEVALLDLRNHVWKHVRVDSISKELLVRSTSIVVDDDLVIVGGGVSCYAFGTKFNEPIKIDLCPLIYSDSIPSGMEDAPIIKHKEVMEDLFSTSNGGEFLSIDNEKTTPETANLNHRVDKYDRSDGLHVDAKNWVLQLERKYAKQGKDILKELGWLDCGRKVYSSQDGRNICLPITEKSYAFFQEKSYHSVDVFDSLDGSHASGPFAGKGVLLNEVSLTMALSLLSVCGGSILYDDVACVRKAPNAPQKVLKEAVCSLIKRKGLSLQLLEQLPTRWERLGDIVVLPVSSFKDPIWDSVGEELWPTVAKSLGAHRLARQV
ncbi:tRNA wybutosine-synthesizing protein 2/3/4 isoform X2 [Magnolia sinica]|uniref:tRNA wybutosine-synthesizing protein 2/3/4 isoform X2 n=1 Tax=Magnolia sinica TaxID=86752 RepID=UPI00265AF6F4|nr:tRNA wybutosine-synthesizing protein 2/3/4 isoform X2 [Magnolia sinica]